MKDLNEIKKALYKEKPTAKRNGITVTTSRKFIPNVGEVETHWYSTMLESGDQVTFGVPASDMGDAKFEDEMPAHLLIRWIRTDDSPVFS